MFNFFKRNKKVNTKEVTGFDSAVKAIKMYIDFSDWVNARKGIDEISAKELESYNTLLIDIENENPAGAKRDKLIKEEKINYEKKKKKIQELNDDFEKKKIKYTSRLEKELFDIRFKKIKSEVDKLLGKREALEAMNLLKRFKNENVENTEVINFYNSEQKKIQKVIEKTRKQEQYKIKQNTQYEALCLIGDVNASKNPEDLDKKSTGFFAKIKEKFSARKNIRENIKSKELLDEINVLLDEDDKIKQQVAKQKLENIHRGLVKEIDKNSIIGYDLYGKILGANKISGDAFGMEETKDNYKFFIGDATGHGIRAGFIITLLNKLFNINYSKNIDDLVFDINNQLKQDLESRNFVTGIFFEIDKATNNVKYVGMGHEPMLVYRKKTRTVDRIVPGGLAMGIVAMKDKNLVKAKDLKLDDGDILLIYSDGLVELKSIDGEFYGIGKLKETFKSIADYENDIDKIYDYIIKDAKLYRGGSQFDDDLTIVLVKRQEENDIVKQDDKYIEKMRIKEGLTNNDLKNIKGKTKKEIALEMEAIRKKKETKTIVGNLESLYYTGEMVRLKEEATRYIKEGYVDKKINYFLKKAIENENKYKINLKNQKMQAKYNVLYELYKKGDYATVIKEIQEIVSKDGNI